MLCASKWILIYINPLCFYPTFLLTKSLRTLFLILPGISVTVCIWVPSAQALSWCLLQSYELRGFPAICGSKLTEKIMFLPWQIPAVPRVSLTPGLQAHNNEKSKVLQPGEQEETTPAQIILFYKISQPELTVITRHLWKTQLLPNATTCLEYPLYISMVSSFPCSVIPRGLMIKTL